MLMAGILSISQKFDYFVEFLVRQNKVAENSGVEREGGGWGFSEFCGATVHVSLIYRLR
jgi:hypothetical protein